MKRTTLLFAGLGMVLLILDSRCAALSAGDALELCLKTVIPSLFPMFILSGLLVSSFGGASGRLLKGLERLTGLPEGSGILFVLGILGGFPVGAQCIAQAVEAGSLSRKDSERMLGFCNNCSPAFLFGIAGSIFSHPSTALLLFLIQLETALLLASCSSFSGQPCIQTEAQAASVNEAVSRAVRSMTSVCAWVILAGVGTGFLDRWLYPLLPEPLPEIITGMLEITGGVLGLAGVDSEALRFVLCSGFVCFGGFSVWMQISSLTSARGLWAGVCFRQKALQGLLGLLVGAGVLLIGPGVLLVIPVLVGIRKKRLEKAHGTVYNDSHKGGYCHVIP